MRDQHGRTLDHLRISVTDRCNMQCRYCKPAGMAPGCAEASVLSFDQIERIVARLVFDFGVTHLRLTGGEPTVRADLPRLVERLARLPIAEIAMTTNGTRLAALARPLKDAGLTRLNISLDTLKPETLARISLGTRLTDVLEGIAAARAAGFHDLKFNAVLMRGFNDGEITDLIRYAAGQGGVMRFIELMPIGVMAGHHAELLVTGAAIRAAVAREFLLRERWRPAGSPAERYSLEDRRTGQVLEFGLIASETEPFCDACRRLRLTADGRLIACLFREGGSDLRPWVEQANAGAAGGSAQFAKLIAAAVAEKPIRREVQVKHAMHVVGG